MGGEGSTSEQNQRKCHRFRKKNPYSDDGFGVDLQSDRSVSSLKEIWMSRKLERIGERASIEMIPAISNPTRRLSRPTRRLQQLTDKNWQPSGRREAMTGPALRPNEEEKAKHLEREIKRLESNERELRTRRCEIMTDIEMLKYEVEKTESKIKDLSVYHEDLKTVTINYEVVLEGQQSLYSQMKDKIDRILCRVRAKSLILHSDVLKLLREQKEGLEHNIRYKESNLNNSQNRTESHKDLQMTKNQVNVLVMEISDLNKKIEDHGINDESNIPNETKILSELKSFIQSKLDSKETPPFLEENLKPLLNEAEMNLELLSGRIEFICANFNRLTLEIGTTIKTINGYKSEILSIQEDKDKLEWRRDDARLKITEKHECKESISKELDERVDKLEFAKFKMDRINTKRRRLSF